MILIACTCDFCKRPLPIISCIDPYYVDSVLGHELKVNGWEIVNECHDPGSPDLLMCKQCKLEGAEE